MKRIITLAVLMTALPSFAVNLQSYKFTDSYRYSFLEDSLSEKFTGNYVITASLSYVNEPISVANDNFTDKFGAVVTSSQFLTLSYSYYFTEKLVMSLDAMLLRNYHQDDSSFFIGDSNLKLRYNFYNKKDLSLAINPQIYLPTGASNSFAEVKELSASLMLIAEKKLTKRLHLLLGAGYFSGRKNHFQDIDYTDLLLGQAGVSYDINEKWNINYEAYRNFVMERDTGQDRGSHFLTLKHKTLSRLSSYFGAGIAGINEVDRNSYTVFAGIKFFEGEPEKKIAQEPAAQPVTKPKKLAKPSARNNEKDLGNLQEIKMIFFANAKADISSQEIVKINEVVEHYKKDSTISHIVIEGYASKTGSKAFNQKISQLRAENVRNSLINAGIPQDKLSIVHYGDDGLKQLSTEAENRRVEFRIYK